MRYNFFKVNLFVLLITSSINVQAQISFYNIKTFGAKGDGITLEIGRASCRERVCLAV